MDGYSVSEAASVLGVPIERVWELLARGVLAGAPEGETGMRVFLHPRAAPTATPVTPPPAENGGAREPERELSPFRELLTEFRNLTERYGQALLALGESRGEVAALRSRVDLLEARMDLGLPAPGRLRTQGWGAGAVGTEQAVVPTAHSTDDAEPVHEADEHRARARGPRRATESFAEALARAEDPSLPELPKPEVESAHEAAQDPVLPRELPVAETVPVAEEADGPMPPDEEGSVARVEDPTVEPQAAAENDPEPAQASESPDAETEPRAAEVPPNTEVAEPGEPVEPVVAGAETDAEPATWNSERYTADIEEPDWYEAEADEAPATEQAAAEAPATEQAAAEAPATEQAAVGVSEPPEAPEAPEAPEETLFWLTGDEAEPAQLPGSSELESALEAFGAATQEPADAPAPAAVPEQPERAGEEAGDAESADPEPPDEETGSPAAAERPSQSSALPPSALRYRPVTPTGPTGRAYRRLRRIFPD